NVGEHLPHHVIGQLKRGMLLTNCRGHFGISVITHVCQDRRTARAGHGGAVAIGALGAVRTARCRLRWLLCRRPGDQHEKNEEPDKRNKSAPHDTFSCGRTVNETVMKAKCRRNGTSFAHFNPGKDHIWPKFCARLTSRSWTIPAPIALELWAALPATASGRAGSNSCPLTHLPAACSSRSSSRGNRIASQSRIGPRGCRLCTQK